MVKDFCCKSFIGDPFDLKCENQSKHVEHGSIDEIFHKIAVFIHRHPTLGNTVYFLARCDDVIQKSAMLHVTDEIGRLN